MPKAQLIFLLHVSAYRHVFPRPSASLLVRVLSTELCVSWKPAAPGLQPWFCETCTYRGHSLDPADWIFKDLLFAQFWGQCSLSAESCQSLFAGGLCSRRSLPACAAAELPNAKGARRRLGFRFPSLPFTYHSGSRANALWGNLFCSFSCSLWTFGFHASKESKGRMCECETYLHASKYIERG